MAAILVMRSHASAPAYPVGPVSSLSGPRAWARLAHASRANFLGRLLAVHVPSMHLLADMRIICRVQARNVSVLLTTDPGH